MDQHSCTSAALIRDWKLCIEAEQTTETSLQRPLFMNSVTEAGSSSVSEHCALEQTGSGRLHKLSSALAVLCMGNADSNQKCYILYKCISISTLVPVVY